MNLWLALRRLLPLLAVLSFALTPVTAPAATAGMHASMAQVHRAAAAVGHAMPGPNHAHMTGHEAGPADMAGVDADGSDMDEMSCCPKEATKPDCAKGCPLMALCLASAASLLPGMVAIPVPVATGLNLAWPGTTTFVSVHGTPLPEPPRA